MRCAVVAHMRRPLASIFSNSFAAICFDCGLGGSEACAINTCNWLYGRGLSQVMRVVRLEISFHPKK